MYIFREVAWFLTDKPLIASHGYGEDPEPVFHADMADRKADQIFQLGQHGRLEVFSPRGEEKAPVLCFWCSEGDLKWCVIVVPEDPAGNWAETAVPWVQTIHLERWKELSAGRILLRGSTNWIMGHEAFEMELGPDRQILGYWYTW